MASVSFRTGADGGIGDSARAATLTGRKAATRPLAMRVLRRPTRPLGSVADSPSVSSSEAKRQGQDVSTAFRDVLKRPKRPMARRRSTGHPVPPVPIGLWPVGRQEFRSFGDVLDNVGRRKHDAALARHSGTAPGAEKPRDVYLDACSRIGAALLSDGFRYLRSKQQLIRDVGRFAHNVSFQSSHDNIAGRHIALWMYAGVRCSALAEWRKIQPHPLRQDDWVAGGMVHLLEMKDAMLEWELANPDQRHRTIDDAVDFIRSVVEPYLNQFDDPELVLSAVQEHPINAFSVGDEIEFACCFGGAGAAQRVLDRFLAESPALHESIRRAVERVTLDGLPEFASTGYADVVAWTQVAYGLTVRGI
jgi:hypothetical protein